MSNEVAGAIERVSSGNHAIHEREHTVVLGWTQQTLPLIKQVGGGRSTRRSWAGPSRHCL